MEAMTLNDIPKGDIRNNRREQKTLHFFNPQKWYSKLYFSFSVVFCLYYFLITQMSKELNQAESTGK